MKIIKRNGYVYGVEGDIGFETYYNLGKDPDYIKEDKPTDEDIKPKRKNTKKEEEN